MAANIATTEPVSFTAGDTLAFTRDLPNYPAGDGWALTYRAIGGVSTANTIDISADAEGDGFSIAVSASETASWMPGIYTLYGYVSKSDERYLVYKKAFTVLRDPSQADASNTIDNRTYYERCLEKVRDVIEQGVITETIEYNFNGTSVKILSIDQAIKLESWLKTMVAQESGNGRQGKILTRFTRP